MQTFVNGGAHGYSKLPESDLTPFLADKLGPYKILAPIGWVEWARGTTSPWDMPISPLSPNLRGAELSLGERFNAQCGDPFCHR